jgi:nicotinamide-nucleotide amidase
MALQQDLINEVRDYFIENKKTIAVAESVTSGNVQAAFSLAKDASKFFQGGITAYNLGQKSRHLFVEPTHALECNCVSEKVTGQMAMEVSKMFSSDIGVATTGFASKVPEQGINNLYAFIAVAIDGKITGVHKVEAEEGEVKSIQEYFTNQLFEFLKNQISSHKN